MICDLIPQDELTLELLAQVLAKMYRHSLNGEDEASDKPEQFGQEPIATVHDSQQKTEATPEHSPVQA